MTTVMDVAITPIRIVAAAKVPSARHKIRRIAERLVGADRAGDVEVMASEAVGNAWLHGTGDVTVTVTCTPVSLRVEVCDQGPGFAVAGRVDHGRGLTIIAALADRYGLDRTDGRTRLWFEVDR